MTLQQIDHRLELFKEYLAYRLDNLTLIYPIQFKKVYPEKFYHWEDTLMSFNQWLYFYKHDDLIDYNGGYKMSVDPYNADKGNFVWEENGAVLWKSDPDGLWYLYRNHKA
jgi:hypothetical protein